jgi:clan AA aspartic protease (TIGR02281 family)
MTATRALAAAAVPLLLIFGVAAVAGDTSSDAVLKSKGLSKVGLRYLLDLDVNLRANLRTMRQAKAQLDSSLAKRAAIDHQLRGAREDELQLYAQDLDLRARMEKAKDIPLRYNQLGAQVDLVKARIRDAEAYISDRQKALNGLTLPYSEYTTAVFALSDRMEQTERDYEKLEADPDVTSAVAHLNADARFPCKLGPSEAFSTELQSVHRERQQVTAAAIKFDREGGVPVVPVTLNGTLPWKMVFDSGASSVILTYAVAQELGLRPEESDRSLQILTADGKSTTVRAKTLKSITLGPFTVENVECVVLPEGVAGANLLGGTFLSNFVYQMDLNAGEIHLSQIGPTVKPSLSEKAVPASRTTGSTRPPVASAVPLDDGSGWIDLLKAVDVARDAITGKWVLADGILSVNAGPGVQKLGVPTQPGGAYQIHLEYERPDQPAADEGLNVALPVGSNSVILVVNSQAIGLDAIDGKRFVSNETTHKGDFRSGKKHQLDISVTPAAEDAKISVSLDGQPQFDWNGPSSKLRPFWTWGNNSKGLCLGAWRSGYNITAFELQTDMGPTTPKERDAATGKKPLFDDRPAAAKDQAEAISATAQWVRTRNNVEQGRCYRIIATGLWTDSDGRECGPDGACPKESLAMLGPQTELTRQMRDEYYCGQHPRGALICRIGDQKWDFYVASDCRFLAPVSGPLSFRMNDDDRGNTAAKVGTCAVTITPIEPEWVRPDGRVEIIARVDSTDWLHLTPHGPYWEWDGNWGKVGLHDGFYPTIINGIYWWPDWRSPKISEKLSTRTLWPSDPARVRVVAVEAKRGDVDVARADGNEVVITFHKHKGSGSSQIGGVVALK